MQNPKERHFHSLPTHRLLAVRKAPTVHGVVLSKMALIPLFFRYFSAMAIIELITPLFPRVP